MTVLEYAEKFNDLAKLCPNANSMTQLSSALTLSQMRGLRLKGSKMGQHLGSKRDQEEAHPLLLQKLTALREGLQYEEDLEM